MLKQNINMSQKISHSFRKTFKKIDREQLNWFPGHMNKGLKEMQVKLRQVDCIIEVHDARIPLSGINPDFKYKISGVKPHILVLNKVDLINEKFKNKITEKLKNEYPNILFTNSKDQKCKGIKRLFPLAQHLIANSDRYNRSETEDYCMMIIGIPNVGKSSLINALRVKYLRRGKATPVGALPGMTRSVLNKIKISEDPLFYLLDTPGILTPHIPDTEIGLKLALCATIQDSIVGQIIIADYLLYWLNKHNYFDYIKLFELEEPNDNITDVLSHICKKYNKYLKIRDFNNQYVLKPNYDYAAQVMLKAFRTGEMGKLILDEDLLKL